VSDQHIPGQWPTALRTSPTRELIRRDRLRAAERAWEDATVAGVAAHLSAAGTPGEVRDAAARIAARIVRLAESVVQQQADSRP
jgi:hypothetical protein